MHHDSGFPHGLHLLVGEVNANVYTIPLKPDQNRDQQVDLFPPQQSPHLAKLQEGSAALVGVRNSLAIGADDFIWRGDQKSKR